MVQYKKMKSAVLASCILLASLPAFAARDGGGMDWILLGNAVAAILCVFALAVPCASALRALRRRPAAAEKEVND